MKKWMLLALLLMPAQAAAIVDDINIVEGDTLPYIWVKARGNAGVINLTGSTVTVTIVDANGTTVVRDAAAFITAPTAGELEYRWPTPNTLVAGTYYIRFRITAPSGRIYTLPADFLWRINIAKGWGY